MRSLMLSALTALCLATSFVAAQGPGASVTLYGAGCRDHAGATVAPVMTVQGLPQLGSTISIRYHGPNGDGFWTEGAPILITGLSSASLPVPRLTVAMASTCTLLVNPDIAVFAMPQVSVLPVAYLDRLSYQIPNVGSLLGASVYHQWATIMFDTLGGRTFDYVMFSNGAQVYVGL